MKRGFFLGLSFLILSACQAPAPQPSSNASERRAASTEGAVENPNWRGEAPLSIHESAFLPLSGNAFKGHGNYLSLPTTFAPVKSLFAELGKRLPEKIQNRGEAHITVITPPEFEALQPWLSMQQIENIASGLAIESTEIEPVCLGRGQVKEGGKTLSTYFIVVKAPNLLRIREAILAATKGEAKDFVPQRFFPHITVGFTKKDLHEAQGVIKAETSCLYPLSITQ